MRTQKSFIFFVCFFTHVHIRQTYSKLHSIPDNTPSNNTAEVPVYIVHVQKPPGTKFYQFTDRVSWYKSFLPNITLHSGEQRMIYAYRHAISGFAARLTVEELEAVEKMDGFVLAHPENEYEVRTTHSPGFLGLNVMTGLWPDSSMGQGQVIGVIDSGIKPTHPSFRDDSLPTPPTKWKGKCYWGEPICNNKLIGATGFQYGKTVSPLDDSGHGTHCASIATGNFVEDADVLGQAKGTASGTAPKAHLAMYKVLHKKGGSKGSDALKGIDEAIRDHVDILSMSLGNEMSTIYNSPLSKASFAALKLGIVPVACSGNSGPFPSVQDNDAPWLLTVGASNMDRKVVATVTLGNGKEYIGQGTFEADPGFTTGQLPLIYPGVLQTQETLNCKNGSMDNFNVTGKIVMCGVGHILNNEKSDIVLAAGGAGMILMNQPSNSLTLQSEPHKIPTANINFDDAWELITKYFQTDPNPTAAINFKGTEIGTRPAPTLYSLSSRGPSLRNGNIIKPDLIAPGVNIVGAWPYEVGANPTGSTKTFTFATGTSMATPHVAGIVALLRNNHPDWSPAAIKSALMTTAYVVDKEGNPICDDYNGTKASVFGIGAGHVDPVGANDPGLIYDIELHDYIAFLCGSGFTDKQVSAVVRGQIKCASISKMDSEQLNYPSISLKLGSKSSRTIKRTVKNVGEADEEYTIKFDEPEGVTMDVKPSSLKFGEGTEELSYEVTFSLRSGFTPTIGQYAEGGLAWDSGKHYVRSPIAVKFT